VFRVASLELGIRGGARRLSWRWSASCTTRPICS